MIPVLGLSRPWTDPSVLSRADNPDADRSVPGQRFADDGYLIVPHLLDADTVDAYCEQFAAVFPERTRGWQYCTPYQDHRFVLDLCTDARIVDTAANLIGEPMGVHLNLSDWRSTQRNWHQDGYLNPDSNLDWYVAVWIALDDIDPDAGPFQFIPGSHRQFDVIRNDDMIAALPPEQRGPDWPKHSETLLTPFFEDHITSLGLPVHEFIARKGDVLFWHSRLLHRGSTPNNPDLERRALIAHYSGITHRPDFPPAVQYGDGWYFDVRDPGGPPA